MDGDEELSRNRSAGKRRQDTALRPPPNLHELVERFCQDSPYEKNVFIMMRYRKRKYFKTIENTIREVLRAYGLRAHFTKDKGYSRDLWENSVVYMNACKYGIAVFEGVEQKEYNPVISLQLGYMYSKKKTCLLLREKQMKWLPADVYGQGYRNFDRFHVKRTMRTRIVEWLEKDLGLSKGGGGGQEEHVPQRQKRQGKDAVHKPAPEIPEETPEHVKEAPAQVTRLVPETPQTPRTNENIDELIEKLKGGDAGTRMKAATALGNAGHTKAALPLKEALRDWDGKVRQAAVSALMRILGDDAATPLAEMAKDWNTEAQKTAIRALGELKGQETTTALAAALKDWNPEVQIEAIRALGTRGSEEAAPALIGLLEDWNPALRGEAAAALGNCGNGTAISALERLTTDPERPSSWGDRTVGDAAREAIRKIREREKKG